MKVEMSESTFSLIGRILDSDLTLPIKAAKEAALAQQEWERAAAIANEGKEDPEA